MPPRHGGCREDVEHRTLRIGENLGIPEAHDPPPALGTIPGTPFIRIDLAMMLAAVEFDHKPSFPAGEIDDQGGDDQLAREGWAVL